MSTTETAVAEERVFTFEELKELNKKDNLHMLIHGRVYAISKFLDEHPGGDEVMFSEAGRDATEAFEDVGHSDEAREILDKYLVGSGPVGTVKEAVRRVKTAEEKAAAGNFTYLLPLAGLVAYLAYRTYQSKFGV